MDNDALLELHLSWLRRTTTRRDTVKHRRDNLRRFGHALSGPLAAATAGDLDRWQASLTVSPSSVQTYTCHVRAFYAWMVEAGLRDDNPARALPVPRLPRRVPRPIPEKDLRLAFRCATGDMIIWLALAGWCGLRAGEIARLRGDSVVEDRDSTTMILRVDGKGGRERIVPVPDQVAQLIRHIKRRGSLFLRTNGQPVTPSDVTIRTGEFFKGIGLPYTLHQLRHRFGTELYRVCKDIRLVQELMGHSSPSTTAAYVAIANNRATRPMSKLGKSLPPLKEAS